MTDLRAALADYLTLRRALGYKLAATERLLGRFLDFMEANDAEVITTALALRWATLPTGATPGWLGQRLSAVRLFAVFVASQEEATQIPPPAACRAGRPAPFPTSTPTPRSRRSWPPPGRSRPRCSRTPTRR